MIIKTILLYFKSDYRKSETRYEVANNGIEALKVVEKVEMDLILLDIIMPNMNGYEVLEFLKKDKRF